MLFGYNVWKKSKAQLPRKATKIAAFVALLSARTDADEALALVAADVVVDAFVDGHGKTKQYRSMRMDGFFLPFEQFPLYLLRSFLRCGYRVGPGRAGEFRGVRPETKVRANAARNKRECRLQES